MAGESAEENDEMLCFPDESQSSEENSSLLIQFQQMYLIASHVASGQSGRSSVYKINVSSSSSSNDSQQLDPIIRLEMDDIYACCFVVCEHTLYAFGGADREEPYALRNDYRFYDLKSPISDPSKILWTSRMIKGESLMNGRKLNPQAVLVDETRFCIFSLTLHEDVGSESYCPPNFELFNTTTEEWTKLDEPTTYFGRKSYIISYYTSHKTFTIHTTVGDYQMKFDVPKPTWVTMGSQIPISLEFPSPGILIDEDKKKKLLFTPFRYMKLDSSIKPFERKDVELKAEGFRKRIASKGRYGDVCVRDGLVFSVRVVLQNLFMCSQNDDDDVPYLLVDIIKNDSEFTSRLYESKEIEAVRSFTFSLKSLTGCSVFMVQCFPVKTLKRTPYGQDTLPAKRFHVDSDNLIDQAWNEDRVTED